MSVSSGSALLSLLKQPSATKLGERSFIISDDKINVQVPISSIDLSVPSPIFGFSCGVSSSTQCGRRQVAVNRRFVVAVAAEGSVRALDAHASDKLLGKAKLHTRPIVDIELQPFTSSLLLTTDGLHVAVTKLVKDDSGDELTFQPVVLLSVGTEDDPVAGLCWLPHWSGVFCAWRKKEACFRLFDIPTAKSLIQPEANAPIFFADAAYLGDAVNASLATASWKSQDAEKSEALLALLLFGGNQKSESKAAERCACVAFAKSGSLAAAAVGKEVEVWSVTKEGVTSVNVALDAFPHAITTVDFVDATQLVVSCPGVIRIVDLSDGSVVKELRMDLEISSFVSATMLPSEIPIVALAANFDDRAAVIFLEGPRMHIHPVLDLRSVTSMEIVSKPATFDGQDSIGIYLTGSGSELKSITVLLVLSIASIFQIGEHSPVLSNDISPSYEKEISEIGEDRGQLQQFCEAVEEEVQRQCSSFLELVPEIREEISIIQRVRSGIEAVRKDGVVKIDKKQMLAVFAKSAAAVKLETGTLKSAVSITVDKVIAEVMKTKATRAIEAALHAAAAQAADNFDLKKSREALKACLCSLENIQKHLQSAEAVMTRNTCDLASLSEKLAQKRLEALRYAKQKVADAITSRRGALSEESFDAASRSESMSLLRAEKFPEALFSAAKEASKPNGSDDSLRLVCMQLIQAKTQGALVPISPISRLDEGYLVLYALTSLLERRSFSAAETLAVLRVAGFQTDCIRISGAPADFETKEIVATTHEKVLAFFSSDFTAPNKEAEEVRLNVVRKLYELSPRFARAESRKYW